MKWLDISMPINSNMQVYKNRAENKPLITSDKSHQEHHICEHRIEMNLHTGTHLDASLHVLPDGQNICSFPLELSELRCTVLDLTEVTGEIMPEHLNLQKIEAAGKAVLLKTKNSFHDEFSQDFVFLGARAASLISAQKPALVGIDSLGIERSQPGHPTHKALFTENVWILEGLRLAKADKDTHYKLHILPLNIEGAEASPVRAVLSEES